jgi:zinc/manganese transport system substrate-binding protein
MYGVRMFSRSSRRAALFTGVAVSVVMAGCGGGSATSSTSGPGGALRVVAAENFWGSIAKQLAGRRAQVDSIIVKPGADPHDYQPTAGDGRVLAGSQLAIVNGIGYDTWASKLLAAEPASGRQVITVGDLLGLHEGDNPHRWYSPADVETVANAITADLRKLDPSSARYFDARRSAFETQGLAQYHAAIGAIRARYAGVPVGASESIFELVAPALGLHLITPPGYMKAISEGTDPTAADKQTIDQQIARRQIKVWVYNSQNSTPDIARLTKQAEAEHIPVTTITETLTPATDSYEQWQTAQLRRLQAALHQATGR